jgi:hypothetical protein
LGGEIGKVVRRRGSRVRLFVGGFVMRMVETAGEGEGRRRNCRADSQPAFISLYFVRKDVEGVGYLHLGLKW